MQLVLDSLNIHYPLAHEDVALIDKGGDKTK
jgi:hypothetical protein